MTTAITLTEHGASRMNEGVIEIDEFGASITGVPDVEEFIDLFVRLQTNEEQAHWCIPDMIVWAEEHNYGEAWTQVLDEMWLNPGTLANRKTIVRKFPKDKRRWNLSQRHYAQLTSLMPENEALAFELLAQAEREALTSPALLEAKKRRLQEYIPQTATLTLTVSADGEVTAGEKPPTWAWGGNYTVTIKEAS